MNAGKQTGQSGMIRENSVPAGADILVDGVFQEVTPADELVKKKECMRFCCIWTGTRTGPGWCRFLQEP
ncbi:MAG: hypothetical protein V1862_10905 [Methanobacteriota archaeon]